MEELSHVENWKNESVSSKQLELNLRELQSEANYPAHWKFFLNFLKQYNYKKILDVGCGVGAYAKLLKDSGLNVEYTGIDYSENAIKIAKNQWGFGNFKCLDYRQLDNQFLGEFDLVHLGAFLDVLPNGNEALEFILKQLPRNVLISRIEITKNPSHFTVYDAYDTIKTYSYKHNQKDLVLIFERLGYDFEFLGNNIHLTKIS